MNDVDIMVPIELPQVPNFLRISGGVGISNISIARFSDAQLTVIGERWTAALIARAQEIRKVPQGGPHR